MLPTTLIKLDPETYNDCDKQVLKSTANIGRAFNKQCAEAYPPLNSGDCLAAQNFCFYQPNVLSHLIAHSRRGKIVDQADNTVVIKNEAFSITAMVFARDKATLEAVLNSMSIQAFGKIWTTKRSLVQSDYLPISNLRHYKITDCGHSFAKFKQSWMRVNKLEMIANAGMRVGRAPGSVPGGPRPAPSSYLAATPLGPASPGDGQPSPTFGSDDEPIPQDMLEAAWQQAARDLDNVAAHAVGSCPEKVLPYYWTTIFFQYSPDLGETQIRLHVNTKLIGPKNLVVVEPFKVYLAAASQFKMPDSDGDRTFSFELFASGNFSLGNTGNGKSVVYNENNLLVEHRAYFQIHGAPNRETINGREVKQMTARGTFPFNRRYDYMLNDISEDAFSPAGLNTKVMKGGAKVFYRVEVESGSGTPTYVSEMFSFIMPPPLTFALMGDSFSSGQGAPVLSPTMPPWLDNDSHRSRYRGMNHFIKESNKACDYKFFACEGATIQDLVDQAQRVDHNEDGTSRVPNPRNPLDKNPIKQAKAQVDLVADWMNSQSYDHLTCAIFSIGGNNSGFADVISAAILGYGSIPGMGVDSVSIKSKVDNGIAYINGPDGYRRVDQILKTKLKVKNIVILGVPDVTHDTDGRVCKSDCRGSTSILGNTFNQSEMDFGANLQGRLNEAAMTAARMPDWHYVDIFKATQKHGICVCNDRYFVIWDDALSVIGPLRDPCKQGKGALSGVLAGASCSFHPTELGYRQYIKPIVDQLNLLYGN